MNLTFGLGVVIVDKKAYFCNQIHFYMTISEKKIELVQALLLLGDNATLFEIEKLISRAFKAQGTGAAPQRIQTDKSPESLEAWMAQFDEPEQPEVADEDGLNPTALRQRIWAAEQSPDMTLEAFFQRLDQN